MITKEFIYFKDTKTINDFIIEKKQIGIVIEKNDDDLLIEVFNIKEPFYINRSDIEFFNPLETGDAFSNKICNVCHKYIDTTEFSINQTGKNNRIVRRPSCKECRKEIDGVSINSKDKKEFNKVKPSFEKFTCPICEKTTIPNLTSKIVLDHDHQTGRARAWICDSCNTGLGRFKDNIKTLEKAIKYLKEKQ